MRVEACCQRILNYILPLIDEKRDGICIDVGVGTFAFYCEMFAMLGFKTVAVEPLPVEGLRVLCQYDGITLIEACLSDVNGTQTIHLGNAAAGLDSNYASLESDWFGVSTETREVKSFTLSKLLLNLNAQKVTCLKLDIEGAESTVITKFGELPKAWLPSVVMFEYGGGDSREKGVYGWSPKYVNATLECIKALKECGYSLSIMIDSLLDTEARIFDLQSSNLEPDSIFYPNGGYGNIIAFRDFNVDQDEVTKICYPYYEPSQKNDGSEDNKKVITISAPEELELSQFQLHRTREELEQSQSQLHQIQGELEQSQSQLHQTQEVLEQYQSQLYQTQEVVEQSQSQLHQTQEVLEQSQSQLHQTQEELEQSRSQLHQTQEVLEESQSQLHQTQEVLEQYQSQLHQTQEELEQSRSQLHQTQEVVEQYQSQLHQTQGELEQSQSQLHQTQEELEQSQSQLHQTQEVLEESQSQLHQTQEVLEESQSQLHQTQEVLQQIKSQLYQKDWELERSRFQLHQTEAQLAENKSELHQLKAELHHSQTELRHSRTQVEETQSLFTDSHSQLHKHKIELKRVYSHSYQLQGELEQSQSQLHQTQGELEQSQSQFSLTQEELEQSQSQFSLTQAELVRTQLQQQYATTEPQSPNGVQHKLLVWDAWYAYQNGDLKKMQQCLRESLKLTSISRTECLINWLDSFVQFSAEKGQSFDTYTLTNLQEWKQLVGRTVAAVKPIGLSQHLSTL